MLGMTEQELIQFIDHWLDERLEVIIDGIADSIPIEQHHEEIVKITTEISQYLLKGILPGLVAAVVAKNNFLLRDHDGNEYLE